MEKVHDILVADVHIRIIYVMNQQLAFIREEYKKYKSSHIPDIKIALRPSIDHNYEGIIVNNKYGIFIYPLKSYNSEAINFLLTSFIEQLLIKRDIFLLHSSSFRRENKAYVFCGEKGAGKSTIIAKVAKNNVMSDDTTVIKKERDQFWVYTSPFDFRKCPHLIQARAVLKGIYFIHKSKKSRKKSISLHTALTKLFKVHFILPQTAMKTYSKQSKYDKKVLKITIPQLIDLDLKLLSTLPAYDLYLSKDDRKIFSSLE